ncbi:hypothetical protein AJ78_08605, partial [Emergomyces pasteurianus Ep9510]
EQLAKDLAYESEPKSYEASVSSDWSKSFDGLEPSNPDWLHRAYESRQEIMKLP